jgi:ATP-dependent helicase HrpB
MMLPIDELRDELMGRLEKGPVVVSSPTASGKSTQVPRWCADLGKVLVVEPRRVACRGLAQRVAELEQCPLGTRIGYSVRDDHCATPATEILFATPGMVLQWLANRAMPDHTTLIIDELHERRADIDLILALARWKPFSSHLVAMSATMDAEAVARHLGGKALVGHGRVFPVSCSYLPGSNLLPDLYGLSDRLLEALRQADQEAGDILVFLPGKAEIRAAADVVRRSSKLEVMELHGGLSLAVQSRVFEPGSRRRVILATNVAETSITVPGIGVVIDSGLVRQTRYHTGRGFLSLVAIAEDSAEQRAGRAGRTQAGVCFRLWSATAKLAPTTPPEIRRESLVPMVLAAAACGADAASLPFLDRPMEFALEAAQEELRALSALDSGNDITERGRKLFGMPLDPHLGRLLIEAQATGNIADAIDLVSVLAVGRSLFNRRRHQDDLAGDDDLGRHGCDVTAMVRALRNGRPDRHGLDAYTLGEARSINRRLRNAFGLPERAGSRDRVDTPALVRTAIAADPRCVHVARRRRGKVTWSNGGTEISLGKGSFVDAGKHEAVVILDSHAIGLGGRETRIIATCAAPVKLAWLAELGLGRDRLAAITVKEGVVVAEIERVYARKVIDRREEVPAGSLAVDAIAELVLRGSVFKGVGETIRRRLQAADLVGRLQGQGLLPGETGEPVPEHRQWLHDRLTELGVESGSDLPLLAADDLLPPPLPAELQSKVDKLYPRQLVISGVTYELSYDLDRREVVLSRVGKGQRKPPPLLSYLPRFAGLCIVLEDRGVRRVLRDHG